MDVLQIKCTILSKKGNSVLSKTIILINPCRSAGRTAMHAFTKYFDVIHIWSSKQWHDRWINAHVPGEIAKYILGQDPYTDLCNLLKSKEIVFAMSCDDEGVWVFRLIQSIINLPYQPVTCDPDKLKSKYEIANYLSKLNLSSCESFELAELIKLDDNISFPLIVKPRDGAGNQNVRILKNKIDFEYFIKSEDYIKSHVFEKYIEGREFCIETTMCGGHPVCTSVMEYKNSYITSKGSPWRTANILIDPNIEIVQPAIKLAQDITKKLGIVTGVTWVQIKIDQNQKPYFIECNFRSQGHPHKPSLLLSTGITFADILAEFIKKEKIPNWNIFTKIGEFSKHSINNQIPDRFVKDVDSSLISSLESVKQFFTNKFTVPGVIPETNSFVNNIGMIMIANQNQKQFWNDYLTIEKWEMDTFSTKSYIINIGGFK